MVAPVNKSKTYKKVKKKITSLVVIFPKEIKKDDIKIKSVTKLHIVKILNWNITNLLKINTPVVDINIGKISTVLIYLSKREALMLCNLLVSVIQRLL